MTDERIGEGLMHAIARLPKGSGIIFRHYSLAPAARRKLFDQVKRAAKARRMTLILAGDQAWPADGSHRRSPKRSRTIQTAAVHSVRERIAAERSGVDLLFVSPIYPTQSHPGGKALGRIGMGRIINGARTPIIALGGMTKERARGLGRSIYGWAAISALMPKA